MLTANFPLRAITSLPSVPAIAQTRTSGGSSDTEENELAVIPYPCSPALVVTTVTPVAKEPSTCRNSCPLNSVRPTTTPAAVAVIGSDAALLHPLLDHPVEVLCCAEGPGDELLERLPLHGEQHDVGLRLGRRFARCVAQDSELAEELAVAQRLELGLAAVRLLAGDA